MRFALIAEGPADAQFVAVLTRLCRSLGVASVEGIHVDDLGAGRRIEDQVAALLKVDPDIDLLFVHMDADNEGLMIRRARIAKSYERCGSPRPYARLVPVRETESWLLVDEPKLRQIAGHPEGDAPLDLPKLGRIEDTGEVKARLREALSRAQRPRKHQKRKPYPISNKEYARLRNQLLESLDIHGPVTQLEGWQALVQDTKTALAALAPPQP